MIGHDAAGALELWHLLYSGIEGSRAMQAFFGGELAELLAHLEAYGSFSSCVVMGRDLFRFFLRREAGWILVMISGVSRCS